MRKSRKIRSQTRRPRAAGKRPETVDLMFGHCSTQNGVEASRSAVFDDARDLKVSRDFHLHWAWIDDSATRLFLSSLVSTEQRYRASFRACLLGAVRSC
jgi:hypothetical protein